MHNVTEAVLLMMDNLSQDEIIQVYNELGEYYGLERPVAKRKIKTYHKKQTHERILKTKQLFVDGTIDRSFTPVRLAEALGIKKDAGYDLCYAMMRDGTIVDPSPQSTSRLYRFAKERHEYISEVS